MQAMTDQIYLLDQYLNSNIIYKKKASSENRYNTTTLANDADFSFSFSSVCKYFVRCNYFLQVASAANEAGFKNDWEVTGGVTFLTKRNVCGPAYTDVEKVERYGRAYNEFPSFGIDATYTYCAFEEFIIQVASSGTLKMRWAQVEARAFNSTLTSDSFIILQKAIAY
jgi:hypothetical protein